MENQFTQQLPAEVTGISDPASLSGRRTVTENFSSRQRYVHIHDVEGSLWEVREARATKHGFDLLFGYPARPHHGVPPPPKPELIATAELLAFWHAHRYETNFVNDLPASASTLARIRRRHGFHFFKDRRNLWQQRRTDFENLSIHEFAEQYGVGNDLSYQWRLRIVGRTARPLDWWHNPAVLELLRGPHHIREVAKQLDIDRSWAIRLRNYARQYADADLPKSPRPKPPLSLPAHWQTPEAQSILRSNLTTAQAAEKLGISCGRTSHLRRIITLAA